MKNEYLKDVYGNIFGVKGEKTFSLDYGNIKKRMDIDILVTIEKQKNDEKYFNVYFIDPIFKLEPMNNLHEQIPFENQPDNWEEYLKLRYISYFAWRQFNFNGYFTKEEE